MRIPPRRPAQGCCSLLTTSASSGKSGIIGFSSWRSSTSSSKSSSRGSGGYGGLLGGKRLGPGSSNPASRPRLRSLGAPHQAIQNPTTMAVPNRKLLVAVAVSVMVVVALVLATAVRVAVVLPSAAATAAAGEEVGRRSAHRPGRNTNLGQRVGETRTFCFGQG